MRNRKLGGFKFRRQVPIGPYIADFCCKSKNLIIEIDGPIHNYQQEYDMERDRVLEATNYQILRFTNNAVIHNKKKVLGEILEKLEN